MIYEWLQRHKQVLAKGHTAIEKGKAAIQVVIHYSITALLSHAALLSKARLHCI
jgi:hypothetical protein